MAAGDLSTDQAKYAQLVAAGTGLDPNVVVSWIGAESGWTVNKSTHNYLNIGPNRSYASTEQAAAAAVDLVRNSKNYEGIRAAAVGSPAAQIEAIGDSPWGTIKSSLANVYKSIAGVRVVEGATATPIDFKLPGWIPGIGGTNVPTPDIPTPGDVAGAVKDSVGKAAATLTAQALQGALSITFVFGAIGIIGLGLFLVTSRKTPVEEAVGRATKLKDDVANTANILSIATPGGAVAKGAAVLS